MNSTFPSNPAGGIHLRLTRYLSSFDLWVAALYDHKNPGIKISFKNVKLIKYENEVHIDCGGSHKRRRTESNVILVYVGKLH